MMPPRGACVLCFDRKRNGETYGRQAFGLLGSLRQHAPELPITVFANFDRWAEKWREAFGVSVDVLDMPDEQNRLIKTAMLEHSPYERTMQIDCDALVRSPELLNGFRWLDRWDVCLATHQHEQMTGDHRRRPYVQGLEAVTGSLEHSYFCSGVLFFGRGVRVRDFFRLWHGLYVGGASEHRDPRIVAQDMYPMNLAIWLTQGLSVFDMGWKYSCAEPDNAAAICVHQGGRNGKPLPGAMRHYYRETCDEMLGGLPPDESADKRLLIAGPYVGELGWEIGNWMPHVRWTAENEGWDAVHAITTPGRAGLYGWADSVAEVPFGGEAWRASNLLQDPPDEVRAEWEGLVAAASEQVVAASELWGEVGHRCPTLSSRTVNYKDARTAVRLEPEGRLYEKWRGRLAGPAPVVVLPVRMLRRGSRKNTDWALHSRIAEALRAIGLFPVTVGLADATGAIPHLPGACWLNETTLADLVAIYSLAACVVGPSTGTMHLAAATGTPHVTWGGDREVVRTRYLRTWNLNGTPVRHLGLGWTVEPEEVLAAVQELVGERCVA